MGRILIVHPGAGAPDLLPIEAWQAVTGAPVYAAPGDLLAARLREAGVDVGELVEAAPFEPATGSLAGRNLLAHTHGEVSPGAQAVADRLAELARDGDVCFISHDEEQISRAVMGRALKDGLEVEFVIGRQPRGHRLLELVRVMARLREPGGCPWDAEQTHQTLAKHLLDETYELLEAIEAGTPGDIAEELGDLLLQVVFHAQMGTDAGTFDVDDVSELLVQKLVRRHPHVFGDVVVSGAREVVANWDEIKQNEKARTSAADGITESLPALAYAQKLQRRAGATGFDWRGVDQALAKVKEEADELAGAADRAAQEGELGDLLFSIVALARHLELDAETALRRAARTFRDRLVHVEEIAREKGTSLRDLSDDELRASWEEAKTR